MTFVGNVAEKGRRRARAEGSGERVRHLSTVAYNEIFTP